MNPLNTQELLDSASQQTQLNDFGPEDFLDGLNVLIDGINNDVVLRADSADKVRERLLRLLMNRLWFAEDLNKHPEILEEDLGSPVIISSLPRTASTKLHRMMGAAPDFQTLPLWKAHMFARIPGEPKGGEARRIQETRDYEKWIYKASPAMLTGHPIFTEEPEEDMMLGEFTFRHSFLYGLFDSPTYLQWLMQADMAPMYDYLGKQLKYLQWQYKDDADKPWLLKTPCHFGNEGWLIQLFGKARFVVTHRNPGKCIPSIASTTLGWRNMYSAECSNENAGTGLADMFSYSAAEHMKWRDANPDVPVLDLSFNEITEDGISAIRKVFAFLDMPLSTASENAMLAWEKNNSREKHGKHRYSAEQVGISEDSIAETFTDYNNRFAAYL